MSHLQAGELGLGSEPPQLSDYGEDCSLYYKSAEAKAEIVACSASGPHKLQLRLLLKKDERGSPARCLAAGF